MTSWPDGIPFLQPARARTGAAARDARDGRAVDASGSCRVQHQEIERAWKGSGGLIRLTHRLWMGEYSPALTVSTGRYVIPRRGRLLQPVCDRGSTGGIVLGDGIGHCEIGREDRFNVTAR